MRQLSLIAISLYSIMSIFTYMIYIAVPAILAKNGIPAQAIGLLYLSMLPFSLSFFCSGFVESFRKKNARNFKILSLLCGLGSAVLLVVLAFLQIDSISLITITFALMCIFASFALIGFNAIVIEQTHTSDKANISTIMLISCGIGGMIGIIAALIIYDFYGWQVTCNIMALCVLVFSVPLLFMDSSGKYGNYTNITTRDSKNSILQTLKTKSIYKQFFILCLFLMPIILCNSVSSVMLVYIGFNMQIVGILSGILNCVAMLLAAPLVYSIIRKCGFINTIFYVITFEIVIFGILALNMWLWQNYFIIILCLFLLGLCFGSHFVFMYSLSMCWCEKSRQSGVDFSFLRLAENISFIIAGILATQIVGFFISKEKLEILTQTREYTIDLHNLSDFFTHSGIDKAVANGYGMLFISAMLVAGISILYARRSNDVMQYRNKKI